MRFSATPAGVEFGNIRADKSLFTQLLKSTFLTSRQAFLDNSRNEGCRNHISLNSQSVPEVPADSATRTLAAIGNVVERTAFVYAMLRKSAYGSFNQFLPGSQSFGFGFLP